VGYLSESVFEATHFICSRLLAGAKPVIVETQVGRSEPERWERLYSKLFWALFICGMVFFAYLYLKDSVIGLAQARQRGTLGAELLRTGIRFLPLVAVIGLSFYLRRYRLPIDWVLSKGRIFLLIYDFAILLLAAAATGFLDRSFWSWSVLLVMPIGYAAAHAIFAESPHNSCSDSASEPKLVR
jgi:hypothetical protein